MLDALENAVNAHKLRVGFILYTDFGKQYTKEAFQERLKSMKCFRQLVEKMSL